jgi:hypothetical protein
MFDKENKKGLKGPFLFAISRSLFINLKKIMWGYMLCPRDHGSIPTVSQCPI